MAENPHLLLVRSGVLPSERFNPSIHASWERCLNLGLDPYDRPKLDRISERELEELREHNALVRRLALIEMRNLHRQIAGSNFLIVLANREGVILDCLSESVSPSDQASARIAPGNIWSETAKGTNALGLVSFSKEPTIVHAEEHYFIQYTDLTCAAAPIYGPTGEMAGIIDATSDCRSRQQHTLALVKMSCLTVENSLFRNHYMERLILEFHSRHEFLGTLHTGILAFERDGRLVRPNRQARFLLQGISLAEGVHFNQIFSMPFDRFLSKLHKASVVHVTDLKGSSFAVKAFNYQPTRIYGGSREPLSGTAGRERPARHPPMVHDDSKVAKAMATVKQAAQLNAPILICGETGTGKELLARYIHLESRRRGKFVAVNCAALPENLVESELFGYAEGAFTGASRGGSVGLVQRADKGTLFLDEIGAMSFSLQAKLLRFLDRCSVRPVGGQEDIALDVQLVSATNSDLLEAVQAGEFREDLFYRINAVEVVLPPLRERTDFEKILGAILETFDDPPGIEREALQLLGRYSWPGNIRELKGFMMRLLIHADGGMVRTTDVEALLGALASKPHAGSSAKKLAARERDIVMEVYRRHKGNISAVARELGISRNTVYKRLKEARA